MYIFHAPCTCALFAIINRGRGRMCCSLRFYPGVCACMCAGLRPKALSVCVCVCVCVCFVIVCLWVGPSLIQRGCLEVMDVWPWLNGARCFGFVALSRLCCCIMNHSFAGRQEEPCGFWLSTLRLTCCSHFHTLGFFFFFFLLSHHWAQHLFCCGQRLQGFICVCPPFFFFLITVFQT